MSYLSCPECGLSIRIGPFSLTVERCPRCLARRKRAVAMVLTDRPAGRVAAGGAPAPPAQRAIPNGGARPAS